MNRKDKSFVIGMVMTILCIAIFYTIVSPRKEIIKEVEVIKTEQVIINECNLEEIRLFDEFKIFDKNWKVSDIDYISYSFGDTLRLRFEEIVE